MENEYSFPIKYEQFCAIISSTIGNVKKSDRYRNEDSRRLSGVAFITFFEEEIEKQEGLKVKLKICDGMYYSDNNKKAKNVIRVNAKCRECLCIYKIIIKKKPDTTGHSMVDVSHGSHDDHDVSSRTNISTKKRREDTTIASVYATSSINSINTRVLAPSYFQLNQVRKNIGFIGAGNMGGAIINGLIADKYPPSNIYISRPGASTSKKFSHLNIANETDDSEFVVRNSDIIFICVKPQIIEKVCILIAHLIDPARHIVLSVAAGVTLNKLETILLNNQDLKIVRCMLNTAAKIGQSCSVYSQNGHLAKEDSDLVEKLLKSTGPCMGEIKDGAMDAAMSVLGCGIAYHFMMTDAMADGGVKLGLTRDMALRLAMQTMKGASELMISQYGIKHHMQMKDEVCSPAGTTIAGLHELEKHNFRNAIISTVEVACNKAKEFQ